MSAVDTMDEGQTNQPEGESRYGVASLDQMDDDEPSSSSSAAAAASASSTAAAAEGQSDAVRTVESYATAVGVIEPPPDLKAIIDRTAEFVRRVGPQFEGEIMQRNKGKKQFQFLENPASPYHAYYKQRVKYGAEGPPPSETAAATGATAHAVEQARLRELEAKKAAEAAAAEEAKPRVLTLAERMRAYIDATHAADKQRIQQAEQARKAAAAAADGPIAPPANISPAAAPAGTSGHIHPSRMAPAGSASTGAAPATGGSAAASAVSSFSFRLKHPEHYSAVDLDIIKLTALYLSRCGTEFLHGLQRREQRNPYFDFLKPQHSLFVYFQHLVDAYNQVLLPRKQMRDQLEQVTRRMRRDEYWQQLLVEAALKKKADAAAAAAKAAEEADRNGLANIDWRDFVVVETISFRDDEDTYLPVPRDTVEEMAAMLSAQSLEDSAGAGAGGEEEMETDMDMDMDTRPTAGPQPPAAAAPTGAAAAVASNEEEEVARLIRSAIVIPDEEQLEIRASADEEVEGGAKPRAAVFQKCIVCGDEIAIDDLAEHMRIELLDPRWVQQKQALLDKQRESSLASDSIVSTNLARLARRVIGGDDKDQDQRAEMKALKQAAADAALLFGPHSQQARDAAARAGQVLPPPPPPPKPAAPAPQPTAPIGPAAYRPAAQAPPAAAAAAATAHIPVNRPLPPTHISAPQAPPQPQQAPQPPQPRPPQQPMPPAGMPPGMQPGMARPPFPGMPGYPQPPRAFGAPPFPGAMPPSPAFPNAAPPQPQVAAPNAAAAAAAAQAPRAAPAPSPADEPASKKQRVEVPAVAAAPGIPAPAAPAVSVAAAPAPVPVAAVPAAAAPVARPGVSAAAMATLAAGGKISEADFRALNPPTVSLRVVVPSDPAQSAFHFNGQTIDVSAALVDTVQSLKEKLSAQLGGMPANKMKLAVVGGAHLNKDDLTLAAYNVPNNATINIGIKERGGKKK